MAARGVIWESLYIGDPGWVLVLKDVLQQLHTLVQSISSKRAASHSPSPGQSMCWHCPVWCHAREVLLLSTLHRGTRTRLQLGLKGELMGKFDIS